MTGGCWSWILQNNGVLASDIIYGFSCVSFEDNYLVGFFNTACLYNIRLGGTKVVSINFNEIFLVLFIANLGTSLHRHSVHS